MNKYNVTFYSQNLYKQLNSVLKSPKVFNKMNSKRKYALYQKLFKLSIMKDYTTLFESEIKTDNQFPEYFEFYDFIKEQLNKDIKRKDSAQILNQLILSIKYIKDFLLEEGYDIQYEFDVSDIDINKITQIILESALTSNKNIDNSEDNKSRVYVKDNEIVSTDLVGKMQFKLILYLSSIVLKRSPQLSDALSTVFDNIEYIKRNRNNYNIDSFVLQLEDIFIDKICNNNIRNLIYTNKQNKIKSYKLISLPKELIDSFINSKHLPEIIEPVNVDFFKVSDMISSSRKIKKGVSRFGLSKKSNEILKISQSKKYIINFDVVILFRELDLMNYEDIKDLDILPFTPISYFVELEKQIDKIKNTEGIDENMIYSYLVELKKTKSYVPDLPNYISSSSKMSEEQVKQTLRLIDLQKDYKKRMKLRTLHNTKLKFAEIFQGYPIYFIEAFDYRLRMYTRSYMFSRTSGLYKYLINDFTSKKVNRDGLIKMVQALTINFDKESYVGEGNLDEILEWSLKICSKYSDKFIIKNDKEGFYKIILKRAILNLKDNKMKTNFMLEVDQRNSVLVIYALVIKSHKVGKIINLTSLDNCDIAIHLKNISEGWFKDKVTIESLDMLRNERGIHKKLLMCFIYNQEFNGRMDELKNLKFISDDALIIARSYPDFLEYAIPGISMKKELFNKIVSYYIDYSISDEFKIETLDGTIISWYVFKDMIDKREINERPFYQSPVTGSNRSYARKKSSIQKKNKKKMIKSFLPSFIHSLDGALMRIIIEKLYIKSKYIITHLHDSMRFHPNEYDNLIECIIDTYTELNFDILNKLIFDKMKENLLREDIPGIQKLIDDFTNFEKDEFEIKRETFNVKNMYRFP
jgi:hypothetical protein